MYKDLTQLNDTGNIFNAIEMAPDYAADVSFTVCSSCALESDGYSISSSDSTTLSDDHDDWVSKTVQVWFKGTIVDGASSTATDYFLSFTGQANTVPAFLVRNGNDIMMGSEESSADRTTLPGVFTGDNGDWMLVGLSMGWLGDSAFSEHVICGYFYQEGNTEVNDCMFVNDISTNKHRSGKQADITIEYFDGHFKELYIMDYLMFPYLISRDKAFTTTDRYLCRENSTLYVEPGYICEGCGNSLVLAAETTEQCDDGNFDTGDGCDDSCLYEDLYKCEPDELGLSV